MTSTKTGIANKRKANPLTAKSSSLSAFRFRIVTSSNFHFDFLKIVFYLNRGGLGCRHVDVLNR